MRKRDSPTLMRTIKKLFVDANKKFSFIVKVEKINWYKSNGNGNILENEFLEGKISITIYKEPKDGMNSLLFSSDIILDAELNNNLLMRMYKDSPEEYKLIDDRLRAIKNQFKFFFETNLQSYMYNERSFSFKVGDIDFKSLSMAGRLMITLTKGDSDITYLMVDKESGDCRMGVNSLHCVIKEAEYITESVILSLSQYLGEGKKLPDILKTGKVVFAGHEFGG